MKTRNDFVSNSSSTSYVIACQKKHLDDIARDLSRACSSTSRMFHTKGNTQNNKCTLDFCLRSFQLLFLGRLLVDTIEVKYSLDYFKKTFPCRNEDEIEREWERYKKQVADAKSGSEAVPNWIKDRYGLDTYDPSTDTAIHYLKTYAKHIIVSNYVMNCNFSRWDFNLSETAEDKAKRVDRLKAFAKAYASYKDSMFDSTESIDVFQITKNTIANTRDLISHGCTVVLDEWEDLDELDARISHGDAVFYVRIGYEGDGHGDFYIYRENGADGISGISGIEILDSESM